MKFIYFPIISKKFDRFLPFLDPGKAAVLKSRSQAQSFDTIPVRDTGAKRQTGTGNKPILVSLLLISEGRDFLVRDTSIRNLFVSCRFINSGSLLTSQICWNVTKPNFHFRHSAPIELVQMLYVFSLSLT